MKTTRQGLSRGVIISPTARLSYHGSAFCRGSESIRASEFAEWRGAGRGGDETALKKTKNALKLAWIRERQEGRERPRWAPHCRSRQERGHQHVPVRSLATSPGLPTPLQPQGPGWAPSRTSLKLSAPLFHSRSRATSDTSPGSRDRFPGRGQVHPIFPVTSKCHRPLGKVVTCSHVAGCHGRRKGLGESPGTSERTA